MSSGEVVGSWPPLPAAQWMDTMETLHLWTQVIGKIRLVQTPWINHSWSVPLYVSPSGLRTSTVPYGVEAFEWAFDFGHDRLELTTTTGQHRSVALGERTVADFYAEVMETMASVGMPVVINTMPNEIRDAVPFAEDTQHASYNPAHARLLCRALLDTQRVLTRFRAGFLGKASPVHFFWGSFDMAVTRFSGRLAPPHPGGVPNLPDDVAREAYSEELTSCGFWPGSRLHPEPIFYAYAYPTPDGYPDCGIEPEAAFWLEDLGEFALRYRDVANATEPDSTLLSFVQSAHDAAAELANWDRARLESSDPHGPDWWENRPPGGYDEHVTDHSIVFRHDPERHRYVAEAEGTVVAKTVYTERDGRFVFVHTEVDPDREGRGVGSDLTRFALDDMRAEHRGIQALCTFTAGWIDRHPDYEDLLA